MISLRLEVLVLLGSTVDGLYTNDCKTKLITKHICLSSCCTGDAIIDSLSLLCVSALRCSASLRLQPFPWLSTTSNDHVRGIGWLGTKHLQKLGPMICHLYEELVAAYQLGLAVPHKKPYRSAGIKPCHGEKNIFEIGKTYQSTRFWRRITFHPIRSATQDKNPLENTQTFGNYVG
ncbi:uncharacterized protein BO72DRAFT_21768 [Aspergillus fijiensis CBS 313.89]|uniref:Uncharacterized protein n=1 Tax=Aspergillus fijiensis CBS 313.89 TaxID=1448319 RepID=A0A8G1W0W9_9EURO|nr:uncharacterized protein BO72DRAFT_21768 [Aspergillus fijiensis CBS 313.89]RAK79817.1 hypothetical protein BO72DRAFT_21768 [Aspergillus fijiensis CBS 313.89]